MQVHRSTSRWSGCGDQIRLGSWAEELRATLKPVAIEDIADRFGDFGSGLVVDGLVVDVGEFVAAHPGGPAVLRANLGRDASADFFHVSAHSQAFVQEKLRRLTVAKVENPSGSITRTRWDELLDHICLVRNSFTVQFAAHYAGPLALIYCGQSYVHLLTDHVHEFRKKLNALRDSATDLDALDIDSTVTASIEDLVGNDDTDLIQRAIRRTGSAVNRLLDPLISICVSALKVVDDQHEQAVAAPAVYAEIAVMHIDSWLSTERSYWTFAPQK